MAERLAGIQQPQSCNNDEKQREHSKKNVVITMYVE